MYTKKNPAYKKLLVGLSKNYTKQGRFDRFTTTCWSVDHATFQKDSIAYNNSVKDFYNQEKDFLVFLLGYQSETKKYNNWVVSKNPCSATLTKEDFIDNEEGALILIDNLLLNNHGSEIMIRPYIEKLKFSEVDRIVRSGNDLHAIKTSYKTYIESL